MQNDLQTKAVISLAGMYMWPQWQLLTEAALDNCVAIDMCSKSAMCTSCAVHIFVHCTRSAHHYYYPSGGTRGTVPNRFLLFFHSLLFVDNTPSGRDGSLPLPPPWLQIRIYDQCLYGRSWLLHKQARRCLDHNKYFDGNVQSLAAVNTARCQV